MTFTALHRALGLGPSTLDDALLDEAVAAATAETTDLDWKAALPAERSVSHSDFPKDIAAMANSGGGLIVYGVEEKGRKATNRVDVGELSETHERALRSAAFTAITPPVLNLTIHAFCRDGVHAVAIEVPPSLDGPHLVYKNDYFGAPIRVDADTAWMKERQIEAMYRTRFEERRHASNALDALYSDAASGHDTESHVWMVVVARPRVPRSMSRIHRSQAIALFNDALALGSVYCSHPGVGHPLNRVDRTSPRTGLRRWIAVNTATSERQSPHQAWASIHHDGSVSIACVVGGHSTGFGMTLSNSDVWALSMEGAVADAMALLRSVAERGGEVECDVRVGIEWMGSQILRIVGADSGGFPDLDDATPLHRFAPIDVTVRAPASANDFYRQVHDVAELSVNQGGVSTVRTIRPPDDGNVDSSSTMMRETSRNPA